jgi:hypothetical protein
LYYAGLSLWLRNHDTIVKIAALAATPGGIWFWIDKYRNCVRIRIRNLGLSAPDALGIALDIAGPLFALLVS